MEWNKRESRIHSFIQLKMCFSMVKCCLLLYDDERREGKERDAHKDVNSTPIFAARSLFAWLKINNGNFFLPSLLLHIFFAPNTMSIITCIALLTKEGKLSLSFPNSFSFETNFCVFIGNALIKFHLLPQLFDQIYFFLSFFIHDFTFLCSCYIFYYSSLNIQLKHFYPSLFLHTNCGCFIRVIMEHLLIGFWLTWVSFRCYKAVRQGFSFSLPPSNVCLKALTWILFKFDLFQLAFFNFQCHSCEIKPWKFHDFLENVKFNFIAILTLN